MAASAGQSACERSDAAHARFPRTMVIGMAPGAGFRRELNVRKIPSSTESSSFRQCVQPTIEKRLGCAARAPSALDIGRNWTCGAHEQIGQWHIDPVAHEPSHTRGVVTFPDRVDRQVASDGGEKSLTILDEGGI